MHHYRETLPRIRVARRDMMKRVARFRSLKGSDGGLPDSRYPGCERILYNVIGFQPPKNEGKGGVTSPVGSKASRLAAIKISEGFNLGYCRALPGHGPMFHNHDTNETFIAMTGTWRASWYDNRGQVQHVDLKPLDLISFPPGVARRFMNVTPGSKRRHAILMFVIGGNAPRAEFTAASVAELVEAGYWKPAPAAKQAAKRPAAKRKALKRKASRRAK
ncbi:MAG TPA: cupin domain-containing protein [Burkholderiales bacterium]|nr:cupin domain-containing protein [Burkholderiales bacterium]